MAHNFGAMLQAYALSATFAQMDNCTCQIIDYRLPEIYLKYEEILKRQNVEKKHIKFEKFMKDKLPLSPRVTNLGMTEKYDLYVIGSDQVWNPNITKGYKDEYFGMCFREGAYCISYGASTGVDIKDWECLAKKLDKIALIGVRETWCVKNLSNYINRKIMYCLDPVFLMEQTDWEKLWCKINYKKYILIYSFEMMESEYWEIENKAKENNWEIIEIVTHARIQRKNIIYDSECGPQEFLSYIHDSDLIYTDSYHGILFSIIFEKPFVYLSRGKKNDARVLDILKQLRLYQTQKGYFVVDERNKNILQKYKKESLAYLQKSVSEVCK